MRILPRGRARILWGGLAALLVLVSLAPAGAASANISHSYNASGSISDGSLVSLDPSRSDYVQLADTSNDARLLGVAVAGNDSLLAVDESAGKVQIATSGTVSTLVSTLGGSIKVGDAVGVSPFSGIGMKAAAGSTVIGLAQTSFDENTQGSVTRTVTDKSGHKKQLTVGFVRLSIAITTKGAPDGQKGLQRVVKNLTGRDVSTLRILISLAVAVIALLILVTLIYASIYGSIISVGRNPLAKNAVFRTLSAVLSMALLTTITAGIIIFFLLR